MTDLTADSVVRNDEVGGKSIATYKDGANKHHQALVIVDPTGEPKGDSSRPLSVAFKGVGLESNILTTGLAQVIRAGFDGVFNPKIVSLEVLNAGGMDVTDIKTCQSGGLAIDVSTAALTGVAVRTKFEVPYLSGIGCVVSFSCTLDNIASPVSGHENRFGIGDTDAGVFIEWTGSPGYLRLRTYIDGVVGVSILSSAWDTPVLYSGGSGLLKPGKIQRWTIRHDWATGRVIISLDGEQVHDYNPIGTLTAPYAYYRNGKATFQITNGTIVGTANTAKLYSIEVLAPGASPFLSGLNIRSAAACEIPVLAATPGISLGLIYQAFRDIHGVSYRNNRVARLKSIRVSGRPNTGVATDSLYPIPFTVYKNRELTSPLSPAYDDTALDPQFVFAGITAPIVATVQADSALLAGYASGDTVMYKVSAVGAYGETNVNTTASVSVNVGTPAKQIVITLATPIPNALAYGIYRRKNGSGNYELIGYADPVKMMQEGFTDVAYVSDAAITAPASSDAEQESFMISYVGPSMNAATGIQVCAGVVSPGDDTVLDFDDGEVLLYPGDTLAVYIGSVGVNMMTNTVMTWWED